MSFFCDSNGTNTSHGNFNNIASNQININSESELLDNCVVGIDRRIEVNLEGMAKRLEERLERLEERLEERDRMEPMSDKLMAVW